MGLVDDARWAAYNDYRERLERLEQSLRDQWLRPGMPGIEAIDARLERPITQEYRLADLLRRPQLGIDDLMPFLPDAADYPERVREQAEIDGKYAGYLSRQQAEIDKARRHEQTELPTDLDYTAVKGLSNEVRQKLADIRPATLGQAARISGVTPAAISLLLVHLKKAAG
jgi:tRNA uridine 5-carboxymethylaminomethyl modification enzyme